jgi:hypothetical protein
MLFSQVLSRQQFSLHFICLLWQLNALYANKKQFVGDKRHYFEDGGSGIERRARLHYVARRWYVCEKSFVA